MEGEIEREGRGVERVYRERRKGLGRKIKEGGEEVKGGRGGR